MNSEYHEALKRLRDAGWTINLGAPQDELPCAIQARYAWLPSETLQYIKELDTAVGPNEKVWLLGLPDFMGSSAAAFKWNEWERMSLDAAEESAELIAPVKQFWDWHFPVAHSVKSGYAYFAIQKEDLSIVCGEEPEFEEPTFVASSLLELLELLREPPARLRRWA